MMPTVPGDLGSAQMEMANRQQGPTPEQLLITAADMHAHGQLTDAPTSYSSPGANLKLPFPGGHARSIPKSRKRR